MPNTLSKAWSATCKEFGFDFSKVDEYFKLYETTEFPTLQRCCVGVRVHDFSADFDCLALTASSLFYILTTHDYLVAYDCHKCGYVRFKRKGGDEA